MTTPRQLEVLRLVGEGLTVKGICRRLQLASVNSVMDHMRRLQVAGLVEHDVTGNAAQRFPVTDAGWAALGMRDCGHCDGTGKLTKGRTR